MHGTDLSFDECKKGQEIKLHRCLFSVGVLPSAPNFCLVIYRIMLTFDLAIYVYNDINF